MLHLGDPRSDDRFEIGDQLTRRISTLRRLGGQRSPNVARVDGRTHGTIFDRDTTVDQPVDQFVSGGAELLGVMARSLGPALISEDPSDQVGGEISAGHDPRRAAS